MLRKIPICMILCVTTWSQQIDKPASVQDRADQRDAARGERASKLKVIDGAETILRHRLGSDHGDDPNAEAPFIHLRLMACLVKGDFSRRASKIYADAADAAAAEVKESEAEYGVPLVPLFEAAEARQKLDEAIHREAELRAKPTPNGVEKAELDGLPAFENQLRETIAIYERIEKSTAAARSSDMARRMREREVLLRMKVSQADANANFYNAQCLDEFSQLRRIDQSGRDSRLLHQFDRLTEGQAPSNIAGNTGSSAGAATEAEGPSNAEKLKEDERILSDPDEMLKRANRLKQLSSPGSSK